MDLSAYTAKSIQMNTANAGPIYSWISPTTMNRISMHHTEPGLGVYSKSKKDGPSEVKSVNHD